MVDGKWRVCVSCAEKEKNASLMKNLTLTVSNPQICTQELGDPKALALVWECFQTLGKGNDSVSLLHTGTVDKLMTPLDSILIFSNFEN